MLMLVKRIVCLVFEKQAEHTTTKELLESSHLNTQRVKIFTQVRFYFHRAVPTRL